jgi:autotransporter translocation and assembly factor TamB
MADTTTSGSYHIQLAGADQSRISQTGNYQMGAHRTSVTLTDFNISGARQTLALAKPFHARLTNDVLHTDTLRLRSKSDFALVELDVPYADSLRQRGYIRVVNLDLSPLQQAVLQESYVKGTLFTVMHFDRTDTSITASGDLKLADLLFAGGKLDSLQLQAHIKDRRLRGSLTAQKDGETLMEGKVDIPFDLQNQESSEKGYFQQKVNGYLTVRPVSLSEFHDWLKEAGITDVKGVFQFHGSLKGEAGQPKLNAQMSLRKGSLSGIPIDSLVTSVNYQHKKSVLDLEGSLTSLHQKVVVIDGQIPLKVDLQHLDVALPGSQDTISVDMKADNFNLKTLNDFMNHAMARNLEGRINGNVHVSGPRDALQINGALHLKKGAVRLVNAGIRLDHMHSTLQFQPDKLVLSDLHIESGQGSLNVQGTLGMKELAPGNLDLSMKANDFKILNTDDYKALANADMSINGSVTSPKVSGSLELINGSITLSNFGEKSVEQVQLDTTLTPETQTSLYDSLSLDMSVSINRRFFVRNQRYLKMDIGLKGKLNIEKEKSEDMQIFGTLSTTSGYAEPLGKRFVLKEGELTFTGPPANPRLHIRTLYEPPQTNQNIKIWYIIKGTVEDPQFEYESDPPMELSSIISYTLFGEPIYKLNSSAQSVSNSLGSKVVSNFAMHFLANRIESLATEKLGVDVVKIENTRVGGKTGTAITTGWYINPKVFFAIQNVITGSTPKPGFYLEYYLRKNLKLILSQGTGNRQGVGADLQWKYDY